MIESNKPLLMLVLLLSSLVRKMERGKEAGEKGDAMQWRVKGERVIR